MKRFQFNLDTVLGYKQQVLDGLRNEHAMLIQKAARQEAVLQEIQQQYREVNIRFRRAEREGLTIAEAMGYENGLRVLEGRMEEEARRLESFRQEAEKKRLQVVGARQETASLEKLREQKLEQYHKAEQKSEEQFIDELVSASRASSGGAG